ncbi:MAG: hypothetical protein RL660_1903, partial [Bacteroidota bacterium]
MSKKILIIEDEVLAYDRLQRMLLAIDSSFSIYPQVYSVRGAITFFESNPQVDLVLLDIHLSDGKSFDIFKHIQINAPIIFATAYDEYALQAFKLNSLDYLMKPIQEDELRTALEKFDKYMLTAEVLQQLAEHDSKYPRNFNLKIGNKHFQVPTKQIAAVYSKDKLSYVYTLEQKHFPVDLSLDKLMESLNPEHFFRANRHLIIQRST